MLKIRQISLSRVIWIDPGIHSKENHEYRLRLKNEFNTIGFSYATSIKIAVSQINSTVKTVLIASGQMGKILMPRIHHLENVLVVLVFCFKTDDHEKWAKDFTKIKGVTNSFEEALKVSKKLLSNVMKNQA